MAGKFDPFPADTVLRTVDDVFDVFDQFWAWLDGTLVWGILRWVLAGAPIAWSIRELRRSPDGGRGTGGATEQDAHRIDRARDAAR